MDIPMAKKRIPALKVELINERGNLLYLSLLEYKRENYLCIVDNITPSEIGAYVLDYADQENIPLQEFLSIVTRWFYGKSESRPLSVEIAQHGLTSQLAPLYRSFDTTYVTRIVGNAFSYDGMQKTKVRRRRVVAIPEGIAIKLKKPALVD
jgi:hypothetical protein